MKRLLVVLIAALMVLSLAACGKGNDSGDNGGMTAIPDGGMTGTWDTANDGEPGAWDTANDGDPGAWDTANDGTDTVTFGG